MTDSIISDTKSVSIVGGNNTNISITVPVGKWLLFCYILIPSGVSGYVGFGFDPSTVVHSIGGSIRGDANSLIGMGNNAIGFVNNNTTGNKTVNVSVWSLNQFTGTFRYFGIKLP